MSGDGAVPADLHRDWPVRQRLSGFAERVAVDQDDSPACGRDPGSLVGGGQCRIQRDDDKPRARSCQHSDDELGVAVCPQSRAVAGQQAALGQLAGQIVDQSDQVAVGDRDVVGGDDERMCVRLATRRRGDQIGDTRARAGVVGLHPAHSLQVRNCDLTFTMPPRPRSRPISIR